MADKLVGYGTLVKRASTAQGEIRSVTPPPRAYERIDSSDLDSTIMADMQGLESTSDFSFEQIWEPGDSNQELVTTDFENRAESSWSIVFPGVNDGSGGALTATQTWTFNARVMSIEGASIDNSSLVMRTVTLNRTGAITTS